MTTPPTIRRFWGWGSTEVHYDPHATDRFIHVLSTRLPRKKGDRALLPIPDLDDFSIPDSALPASFVADWSDKGLSVMAYDRLSHALGKSYYDLLRLRLRQIPRYPDGVLFLEQKTDLPGLFQAARQYGITLIPFGGGTGVVGGTECLTSGARPVLIVHLRALNQMIALDEVSQTATVEAGILGPQLEIMLNARGYTLGHFPQSFEFSTLGGWAVTRSAGQNSTKYGKIEKVIVSLTMVTPQGELVIKPVPASASGPSLKDVIIGSEGIYGIVTEVTVKICKQPAAEKFLTAFFKDFKSGTACIRALMQGGLRPSIVRLSDAPETELLNQVQVMSRLQKAGLSLFSRLRGLGSAPCLFLIGVEGSPAEVTFQVAHMRPVIGRYGGAVVPKDMGAQWKKNRFMLPYLRDPLMTQGFYIDTLETAVEWAGLEGLHRALYDALAERQRQTGEVLVLGCHVSHAYPDGASLYFTILGRQRDGSECAQWHEIKTLATDTIIAHGGALSHHHGIGADHRPWMLAEHGKLGMEVLHHIKTRLDPDGLLNPGKVL